MGRFRTNFRAIFLTGLLVSIPILITLLSLWWFFSLVDGLLGPLIRELLGRRIPGLGFLAALLLILCVGLFATNVAGQRLLTWAEGLLLHIPIAKSVYMTVKQLMEAFSPSSGGSFKRFVLVEYPRSGIYAFGFLTDKSRVELNPGHVEEVVAVYIPTNHLYLGEVVLFKGEEVIYPDMTVEEGVQVILSGGLALPSEIRQRVIETKTAIRSAPGQHTR